MAWEGNPCNMHLSKLQDYVHDTIKKSNKYIPRNFYTIGISDGIHYHLEIL